MKKDLAESPATSPGVEPAPDGYAYRYPDGIRYGTGGRTINGSDPLEVIPFYFKRPENADLRRQLQEAQAKIKELELELELNQ